MTAMREQSALTGQHIVDVNELPFTSVQVDAAGQQKPLGNSNPHGFRVESPPQASASLVRTFIGEE